MVLPNNVQEHKQSCTHHNEKLTCMHTFGIPYTPRSMYRYKYFDGKGIKPMQPDKPEPQDHAIRRHGMGCKLYHVGKYW